MKRLVLPCAVCALILAAAAPAGAIKVVDPTPNQQFSDTSGDGGNQGYVEVASDDGSGNLVRACNENEDTPAGDDLTGYIWVNPNGEDTTPTYGNETIGAGDEDGEDGTAPQDIDEDTNDDCEGNDNDPDPNPDN